MLFAIVSPDKKLSKFTPKHFGWGYTHDRRADKDSYPHDRNVIDDLCSLTELCFAFIMVNFST